MSNPAPHIAHIAPDPATLRESIVVVGGGPVGMRAANALGRKGHFVTLLSAESFEPYNRVRLTPLLGGEVQFGEITIAPAQTDDGFVDVHTGCWVMSIDRIAKTVRSADGRSWPYSKLILATGSSAFVPNIPGKDLTGVYTFRTAEDVSALLARSFTARKVAVIGGGLLGLEAARGMRLRGCEVNVIEHEERLMPRQLDSGASELLTEQIKGLDVAVRTGVAVREITGTFKAETLHLSDGAEIEADTVIICTGVRANIALARDADLGFHRGILVDDHMQTKDPNIFAIGECCEHDGRLYGLVGPGFEQADVAVAAIGGSAKRFSGAIPATKLKVIGAEVFSVGEIEQLEVGVGVRSHTFEADGVYRRIFIRRGKLVGAIAIGDWSQVSKVQSAAQEETTIYPWMVHSFRKTGLIWKDSEEEDSAALPDAATVCNCTGVKCGRLREAIAGGCNSVEALGQETSAGTVCGTCHPILEELLNAKAKPKGVRWWKTLLAVSGIAALAALITAVIGRVPFPQNFDAESLRMLLWRDPIIKQWTGFILLGITLVAMVIGLRKRIRFMDRLGGYDYWRLIHLGTGIVAAVGLFAHTGLRPGDNLNLWLFISFTATLTFGALAGLFTGGDHELRARRIGNAQKPARRVPTWLHILAVWPLPALILAHVLISYAY